MQVHICPSCFSSEIVRYRRSVYRNRRVQAKGNSISEMPFSMRFRRLELPIYNAS